MKKPDYDKWFDRGLIVAAAVLGMLLVVEAIWPSTAQAQGYCYTYPNGYGGQQIICSGGFPAYEQQYRANEDLYRAAPRARNYAPYQNRQMFDALGRLLDAWQESRRYQPRYTPPARYHNQEDLR